MLKIDQYSPVQSIKKSAQPTAKTAVQETVSTAVEHKAIGAATQQLQQAFETLNTAHDVDLGKVAAIKAALSNGTFALNDAQTAQDILEFHKR